MRHLEIYGCHAHVTSGDILCPFQGAVKIQCYQAMVESHGNMVPSVRLQLQCCVGQGFPVHGIGLCIFPGNRYLQLVLGDGSIPDPYEKAVLYTHYGMH